MPQTKRCLAFALVIIATLGNSTRAGSYSGGAGNWYWWSYLQSHGGWAQRPWNSSARTSAPAPVATPAPAPASPAPVYSASVAPVSSPLVAVPYNDPTSAPQPSPAYVAPSTSVYIAPVSAPLLTAPAPTAPQTPHVNGFINMGTGPFPTDSAITTGGTQPWFNSSQISGFFGGQPTPQQQADFSNAVLQDVQHTFALSGVNVQLTNNPNVPADHTLSVVSNTSAALLPSAIGMTQLGGSGFSFMDQEAKSAQSLNQLEWIVAHNVSHELMLAFGVGENYDHTGNYIDAPNASFAMMTSDSATFSKAAADALNQALQQAGANASSSQFAQEINGPQPVPEPATIAIWTVGGLLAMVTYRKRVQASVASSRAV